METPPHSTAHEMNKVIKIKFLTDSAAKNPPAYKTHDATCMDVCSDEEAFFAPGETVAISLGFALQLPPGASVDIRPRSGISLKNSVFVILGTIDADYRGEVKAIVHNSSKQWFQVRKGDRIAQMKYYPPSVQAVLEPVLVLDETQRGTGGFGSTGV